MSPIEQQRRTAADRQPNKYEVVEISDIFSRTGYDGKTILRLQQLNGKYTQGIIPVLESVLLSTSTGTLKAGREQRDYQVSLLKYIFEGNGTVNNSEILGIGFNCLRPVNNMASYTDTTISTYYQRRRALALADHTNQVNNNLQQKNKKQPETITQFEELRAFLLSVKEQEGVEAWSKLINFADRTPLEFLRGISSTSRYVKNLNEMLALALLTGNAHAHSLPGFNANADRRKQAYGSNEAFKVWLNLDETQDSSPTALLGLLISSTQG